MMFTFEHECATDAFENAFLLMQEGVFCKLFKENGVWHVSV